VSVDGWCSRHRDRLLEAKDARLVAETLIVKLVLETGRHPGPNGCWACPLSENEFQGALREGGTLAAKAEAYGGTYTAKGISLSIGSGGKDDAS
jgi:hypothetical protein